MTDANGDISHAFLQAVAGEYPDSEAIASAELGPGSLPSILKSIREQRDQVQAEVSQISREVAPDVDGWIQQAKQLQDDIQRSKATAREVVQQAEEAASLRQKHKDITQKATLLSAEVSFTKKLKSALENIRFATDKLVDSQYAATNGQLEDALKKLRAVEVLLVELRPLENTNAVELLHERVGRLKMILIDEVKHQWDLLLNVERTNAKVIINAPSQGAAELLSMEVIVELSSNLDLLDTNIRRSCRDLTLAVFKPRLEVGSDEEVAQISLHDHELYVSGRRPRGTAAEAIDDVTVIAKFLNHNLPSTASIPLSEVLMPLVISRLISQWLMPDIPTSLDHMQDYQLLLKRVQQLAADLTNMGWSGAADLKDWVEQGPRIWLARRRESSLVAVRDLLSQRISETKQVERVETQMVSREDAIAASSGGGDDWDAAWTDEENVVLSTKPGPAEPVEEDDFSAWDASEGAGDSTNNTKNHMEAPGVTSTSGEDEEGDAWGWDDQNGASAPSSPVASRKQPRAQSERELTLKESYIITGVPDELRSMIAQIIHDAEILHQPQYASLPIAPAAAGLYTLPTLILASFRALAQTYYAPLPGGNMYLYNDSTRLALELTALSTNIPSTPRLDLPTAIITLSRFSKLTYGREMDAQRTILRDLLDGAQGFANCTSVPFAAECSMAVDMAVDRVRALAAEWAQVLSRSALLQSLGSLVAAVVEKMTGDMMDLPDISEEESRRLRELCERVGGLRELFREGGGATGEGEQGRGGDGGEGAAASGPRDLTGLYVPNWFRFQYLSEIMESSLADIRYLWAEGDLKLEFDAGEVIDLIEALFAESEYRRRAIAEIRRG